MTIIGYYFLCRPGEHTICRQYNHPFLLQDITFETPQGPVNAATGSLASIRSAHKVLYNFSVQKNGDRNQPMVHGDTSDPLLSPLKATQRQVLMLRSHKALPTTPLCTYFDASGKASAITSSDITKQLKLSAAVIGPSLGIRPKDVSARALRNGGCVALIRAGVDPFLAKLIGRWKSWAMVEYLQAASLDTTPYAQKMLQAGSYVIPSHQTLPQDVFTLVKPYIEE